MLVLIIGNPVQNVQGFPIYGQSFYAQCGSETETLPVSIRPAKCQI